MGDMLFIFFFQAEDGIRDRTVTGVQTCALPILFGRPLDDLPGMPIDDVVALAEREHVAARERRAFEGEEQHYETKVVRANGEERIVAVSTTPLVVDGELLGAVATLRDITEQKRAQETLASSEARYRNLFESAY